MSRYRLCPTPAQERATHRKPTWRKRGQGEGFRIVAVKPGDVRRVSRNVGEVRVPKMWWVRFRWSRAVPGGVKSYRITRDKAGRWHVAFAAIPAPILAPGTGEVVGVDRGVVVSAALSTAELLSAPRLREAEKARLPRLPRKLARAKRGSNRRAEVKAAVAKLKAREADRRRDWVEKTSTDLARRCVACGWRDNADINAAKNIRDNIRDTAMGPTVAARGGAPLGGPANREPQRDLLLAG